MQKLQWQKATVLKVQLLDFFEKPYLRGCTAQIVRLRVFDTEMTGRCFFCTAPVIAWKGNIIRSSLLWFLWFVKDKICYESVGALISFQSFALPR